MTMRCSLFIAAALLSAAVGAPVGTDPLAPLLDRKLRSRVGKARPADVDSFVFLNNGIIQLGIDVSRGASVGWFGPSNGSNAVNIHDFGRETQVSYYAGPAEFNPPGCNQPKAYDPFPYNPIGAGDYYGNAATILSVVVSADNSSAVVTSIPQQWACNATPAEAILTKTITLVGNAAEVATNLSLHRADRTVYPAFEQELPAVYVTGALCSLWAYVGDAPYTNDAPTQYTPPQPAEGGMALRVPEQWMAFMPPGDPTGQQGMGLWHPQSSFFAAMRWNSSFKGCVGGPYDDVTGYMSARYDELLDWNNEYLYNYTLLWGDLDSIRSYAAKKAAASGPGAAPDWHFTTDRQHFTPANCNSSYPITGYANLLMEDNDPNWISGYSWWLGADAPVIYVTAAYGPNQHDTTAQLFYQRADMPGFDSDHVVTFSVTADGVMRTYAVPMASAPGYSNGTLVALRLDPVIAGAPGAWVNISSITYK